MPPPRRAPRCPIPGAAATRASRRCSISASGRAPACSRTPASGCDEGGGSNSAIDCDDVRGRAGADPGTAMTAGWRSELAVALGAIGRAESIAGGDINDAWRVELADGRRVFVKSHAAPPPGMFAAEADGLAWLSEGPLRVPRVLAVGASFLALEWIDLGHRGGDAGPRAAFEARFGRGPIGRGHV